MTIQFISIEQKQHCYEFKISQREILMEVELLVH